MQLRRCCFLFVLLVIVGTSAGKGGSVKDHERNASHKKQASKQANVPFAPTSSQSISTSSSSHSQLMSRKISDAAANNRQSSLLAGPLFLGLSSLLLPALPMLLLAPIAVAGLGPAVNYVSDALGSSSSSNSASGSGAGDRDSALSHVLHSLAQSNSGISSALQTLAQKGSSAGSGGSATSGSSSSSSATSGSMLASASSNTPAIASPSSASSNSISASVAQALGLTENSGVSSGDSSSILSGITNFFGPDRNSPAGSSSLSQLLSLSSGNGRPSLLSSLTGKKPANVGNQASSASSSSQSMPDYIGAAAAALDNAGLLGPISGAGSGSMTDRLFGLMTGSSHKNPGSSASGSGGVGSSSGSSSLADLLGLGSSASVPASSPSSSSSSSSSSLLGSSLSSNIIQNLPQSYSNALAGIKTPIKYPSTSLSSSQSQSSGSIQSLANNALNKISSFIFSRRRSEWIPRPYPGFGYLDNANSLIDNTSAKVRSSVVSYLKDAYSTLKDGIRKYEVAEPECQARLICELNQKSVGRSFGSYANTILDVLGIEDFLESSTFNARAKSVMKDMYHAAKNGMVDKNCAEIYAKCPVSISVEPLRNTLLNKLVRGSGHNILTQYGPQAHQMMQIQSQLKEDTTAHVYGPSVTGIHSPQQQQHQQQQQQQHQQQQHQQQQSQQSREVAESNERRQHQQQRQQQQQQPVTKSSLTTPSALSILPSPTLSKPVSTASVSISQPENAVSSKQQHEHTMKARRSIRSGRLPSL